MERADGHLHLFEQGFGGVLGQSPAGGDEVGVYERLRRHYSIARGLVIGYEGDRRYAGNNEYVLELARTRSWIEPVAYIPTSPVPIAQEVAGLGARGFIGYSLYLGGEADGRAVAAWPQSLLAELCAQRAIVSVNARPAALEPLAEILDRLRDCTILISHLGLPGRQTHTPSVAETRQRLAPLLAVARLPNVHVKLSGLYAITDPPHDFAYDAARPFVDVVLDAFGAERLLWGSDFSPALDFVSFAQIVDDRILRSCASREIEEIMGGNLLRLLADTRRE
jgi:L-fuconolactonase